MVLNILTFTTLKNWPQFLPSVFSVLNILTFTALKNELLFELHNFLVLNILTFTALKNKRCFNSGFFKVLNILTFTALKNRCLYYTIFLLYVQLFSNFQFTFFFKKLSSTTYIFLHSHLFLVKKMASLPPFTF